MAQLSAIYQNMEFFRTRLVLRPREITNRAELVHRLEIASVDTAIEVHISGNVNITHALCRDMMEREKCGTF